MSLSAVEALAAEAWPQLLTAVVALPDARKGERLVLLTPDSACTRETLSRLARQKGLSELMVPSEIVVVSKVPLLGSGKPDYVAALALAKEQASTSMRKPEALVSI